VKSWPGGKGTSKGSPHDWQIFLKLYGFTEEQALAWKENPIDLLAPVAKAKIPIIHVVGDADDVVPVLENTTMLVERYRALGGKIEVISKPGIGHHPHSLEDPIHRLSRLSSPQTSSRVGPTFSQEKDRTTIVRYSRDIRHL
jgi:hypothetical protein